MSVDEQAWQLLWSLIAGPTIAALVAWFGFTIVKKRIQDLEKIPSLESRVITLEQQAIAHNETKYAMIRMEEQIKHLSEQVKNLTDLLRREVLNNG